MDIGREDIVRWLKAAKDLGDRFVFIVYDFPDGVYWPMSASYDTIEDIYESLVFDRNSEIIELYDLMLDINKQLSERRALNYPKFVKGL